MLLVCNRITFQVKVIVCPSVQQPRTWAYESSPFIMIPEHCIALCHQHAPIDLGGIHLAELLSSGRILPGACATRLFDVAVASSKATSYAIDRAGAGDSAIEDMDIGRLRSNRDLYFCSLAFEDDPSAQWNLASTNMQLMQYERNFSAAVTWAEKAVGVGLTHRDKALAHYSAAINIMSSGLGTSASITQAESHLQEASALSPHDVGIQHSLATLQYVHLRPRTHTFDKGRSLILEKASGMYGCPVWSESRLPFGNTDDASPWFESNVYNDAVVYGKSVSIALPKECKFVMPDRSWELASYSSMKEISQMNPSYIDTAFLAVSFAPGSFYMAVAQTLTRIIAWVHSRRTTFRQNNSNITFLVPSISGPLQKAIQQFLDLKVEKGYSLRIYESYLNNSRAYPFYRVKTLHMLSWKHQSSENISPDFPPQSALTFSQNMLRWSGILPLSRFLSPWGREETKILKALLVQRNSKKDTRFLGHSDKILNMLKLSLKQIDSRWHVESHVHLSTVPLKLLTDVHMIVGIHGAGLANMMLCGRLRAVVEITRRDLIFELPNPQAHYQSMAKALNINWFHTPGWSSSNFHSKLPLHLNEAEERQFVDIVAFAAVSTDLSHSSVVYASPPIVKIKAANVALDLGLQLYKQTKSTSGVNGRIVSYLSAVLPLDSEPGLLSATALYSIAELAMRFGHSRYAVETMRQIAPGLLKNYSLQYGFKFALMKQQLQFDLKSQEEMSTGKMGEKPHKIMPIARYKYGDLTLEEFTNKFARQAIPVIFEQASSSIVSKSFSKDSVQIIKKVCGFVKVQTMQYHEGSVEWASLEQTSPQDETIMIKDFVNQVFNGKSATAKASNSSATYLVDASIRKICPQLLNVSGFQMPHYFQDFLPMLHLDSKHEDDNLSYFRDHWPSLFIGAAGTRSGLHQDSVGSFWQLVVRGNKKWVIYNSSQAHFLKPKCLRRGFEHNAFKNIGTSRYEAVLGPG